MKAVRRLGCCLGWLLLLAGSIALFLAFTPRPRLLLEVATKIGPIPDAEARHILSDRKALLFQNTSRPHDPVPQGAIAQHLYLLDVPTGSIAYLPKMTAWYNRLPHSSDFLIHASPDGNWLLFWQETTYHGGGVASTDGQQQWNIRLDAKTARFVSEFSPCWMSDSRHWIKFPINRHIPGANPARIYAIDGPERTQPHLADLEMPKDWNPTDITVVVAGEGRIIGLSRQKSLTPSFEPTTSYEIYEMRLQGSKAPIRKNVLSMPPDHVIWSMTVSPQGDRVAWISDYSISPSPFMLWWAQWIPGSKAETQYFKGLWVSRIDGTGMREIARIETPSPLESNEMWTLVNLAWLADGKRLRFLYKNDLYTVPVD